jgi:hypothetical protein
MACAGLGNSEPAILLILQFRGTQTQWLRLDELASRLCHLTPLEHATITFWISRSGIQQFEVSAETSGAPVATEDDSGLQGSHVAVGTAGMHIDPVGLEQALPAETCMETVWRGHLQCPQCIRGQIIDVIQQDRLVLQCTLKDGI